MKPTAIAVLVVGALLALTGCDKAVPDLKGMTSGQAKEALAAAGFRLGEVTYDEKAEGTPWTVMGQEPRAGEHAKAGTVVAVTLVGPFPITTPTVDALSEGKAKAVLESVGLELGDVTRRYDDSVAAGAVISQDPATGDVVPEGSAVAVVISRGPAPVPIPNVIGKTEAAAKKLLKEAGFKAKVVYNENPADIGTVVLQKPASGKAQPGSSVVITVSIGIDMVIVPRVVGKDAPKAEAILKANGLEVQMVVHNGPAGTVNGQPADIMQVYRQVPAAGSLVPRHTVVRIYWWSEAT